MTENRVQGQCQPALQVWDDLWDGSARDGTAWDNSMTGLNHSAWAREVCLHAIGRFVLIVAERTSRKRIKQEGGHSCRL
jgi:hypothetical protein